MFRTRFSILPLALVSAAFGQAATNPPPIGPQPAIKLAQAGLCEEAVPALSLATELTRA